MDNLIKDFVKRSRSRYTESHIKQALEENLSIVTDDGFICFAIVQDECHVLFCYVRPGAELKPFAWAVETYAKEHGCKVVKWLTHREKAFLRAVENPNHPLYGYAPTARMFEKQI